MSKLTRAVVKWIGDVAQGNFRITKVYTNLPKDHEYYLELSEILIGRRFHLIFDGNLEIYSNSLNVWFRVNDPDDRKTVPVMNALYRALLSLDMIKGK